MTVRLAARHARAPRFGPARVLDDLKTSQYLDGSGVRLALDPAGAGVVTWTTPGSQGPPDGPC